MEGELEARVLVVEDDTAVAETVCEVLSEHGFLVSCVPHGGAALQELARERFDVVVTDLSMPRMDGRKLVRAMRRQKLAVPIVLLSARPDTPLLHERLGSDAYLMKPFDINELVTTVRDLARTSTQGLLTENAAATPSLRPSSGP